MPKMTEEGLLRMLQDNEERSAQFVSSVLGKQRRQSLQEYYRQAYGNEEEGWSGIVTSEVQDTVEWVLPELLEMFVSGDDVVSFDPTRESEVEGAAQAMDTCNYVFHKQNPGFMVLYTAFKDALMLKNGAIMWRRETRRMRNVLPVTGATDDDLSMAFDKAGDGAEFESAVPREVMVPGPMGMLEPMRVWDARIVSYEEREQVIVDAFEPENLLVDREWTSPLLANCPYICRNMRVTLSDVHQMGYDDVTSDDLAASQDAVQSRDGTFRRTRTGGIDDIGPGLDDRQGPEKQDDSQTLGWLRIEFILCDFDGDGVAERRMVVRLQKKVLYNEECAQVQIATGSPIVNTHRWDGMSLAELMSDLQAMKTDITRAVINNAVSANNPRKQVLMDASGNPMADIDDLLDGRPGGLVRVKSPNALGVDETPFVGGEMFPLLEYVDHMGERRTGVTKQQSGTDPDALRTDRTAYEVGTVNKAAKQRIRMIGRLFAETLVAPTMLGILQLLTSGGMKTVAMQLRGKFVEYNPQEWRDQYDMTIHVGLGNGDRDQQAAALKGIQGLQVGMMQSPFGPRMLKPKHVYNTAAKLVQNAGFKNVGDFFMDPGDAPLEMPPPPPNPMVQAKQLELQARAGEFNAKAEAEMHRLMWEAQNKRQEARDAMILQASNDARDAQREQQKAANDQEVAAANLLLDKYRIDVDAWVKLQVADVGQKGQAALAGAEAAAGDPPDGDEGTGPATLDDLIAAVQHMTMISTAPKRIVRGADGRVEGVEHGGVVRPVQRDEMGRVAGLQ